MYFIYDNYESVGKARKRVEECSAAFGWSGVEGFKFEHQKVTGSSINVLVECPDELGNRDDVAKIIRSNCIAYRKMKRTELAAKNEAK